MQGSVVGGASGGFKEVLNCLRLQRPPVPPNNRELKTAGAEPGQGGQDPRAVQILPCSSFALTEGQRLLLGVFNGRAVGAPWKTGVFRLFLGTGEEPSLDLIRQS